MFTIIIYSVATAFFLVEIYQLHYRFSWSNRKPFNCLTCLSGWVSMPLTMSEGGDWFSLFGNCFLTMLVATIFIKLYKKYL